MSLAHCTLAKECAFCVVAHALSTEKQEVMGLLFGRWDGSQALIEEAHASRQRQAERNVYAQRAFSFVEAAQASSHGELLDWAATAQECSEWVDELQVALGASQQEVDQLREHNKQLSEQSSTHSHAAGSASDHSGWTRGSATHAEPARALSTTRRGWAFSALTRPQGCAACVAARACRLARRSWHDP